MMKYTFHVMLCSLLISAQVEPMLAGPSQLQKAMSALVVPIFGRAMASTMNEDTLDYCGFVSKFHVDAITNSRKKCAELLQNQSNEKQNLLDEQRKEEERKKRERRSDVIDDVTDAYALHSLLPDVDKKDGALHHTASLQRLMQDDLSHLSNMISDITSSVAETVSDVVSSIEDSDHD